MKKTTQFGEHFMLDGYHGNVELLNDQEVTRKLILDLIEFAGMTTIAEMQMVEFPGNDKKDPGGHSALQMIAESHVGFHTFPKRGFVSCDIYTCKEGMPVEEMQKMIVEAYALGEVEINHIPRGTKYPLENI